MNLFNAGAAMLGGGGGHGNGGFGGGGFNPLTMFQQLDKDGNGTITESDFVAVAHQAGLGYLGELAIQQVFRQIDTNRNGRLDFGEALSAFQQLQQLTGSFAQ